MKKLLLISTLFAIACPAFAHLGNTYAQSCREYGGRGTVNAKNRSMVWHVSRHYVQEWFVNKHCVCVMLQAEPGSKYGYSRAQAQEFFATQSLDDQVWAALGSNSEHGEEYWMTTDKMLSGTRLENGRCIQVAFTNYLEGKGLTRQPDNEGGGDGEAPVEDSPDGTNM